MTRSPAFQFYPKDYLSDRHVANMSPEARGGYWHLCCHLWETGGYVPEGATDDDLADYAGMTAKEWARCKSKILRAFKRDADGRLYQKRIVEETEKQADHREQQAAAGRASAAGRAERKARSTTVERPLNSVPTKGQREVNVEGEREGNSSSASSSASASGEALSRAPARDPGTTGYVPDPLLQALAAHKIPTPPGALVAVFREIGDGDPNESARAVEAFVRLQLACVRHPPGWNADAVRKHSGEIQRILAGEPPTPERANGARDSPPKDPRKGVLEIPKGF